MGFVTGENPYFNNAALSRVVGHKPVPSALLHFSGKVAHGLLRDEAAFTSGKGGFRLIDGNENFHAGALAFFPQGKGFLYRIFLAVKPAALNSLADKGPLVRCELYFHRFYGSEKLRVREGRRFKPRRIPFCPLAFFKAGRLEERGQAK